MGAHCALAAALNFIQLHLEDIHTLLTVKTDGWIRSILGRFIEWVRVCMGDSLHCFDSVDLGVG